jgi:hypothetical protein
MLTSTKVSNLAAFALTVVEGFIVSDSDGSDSSRELVSLKVQLKPRCPPAISRSARASLCDLKWVG